MFKLVTCPETAHLEWIELEAHPLGTLIHSCSAFRPACAMTCARTCAARLDRRAGIHRDGGAEAARAEDAAADAAAAAGDVEQTGVSERGDLR